jgi:hypothetical protein
LELARQATLSLPATAAELEEINRVLGQAFARRTFEPMRAAWEGLRAMLGKSDKAT